MSYHQEYDLAVLGDQDLVAGVDKITRVVEIIGQYRDIHLDATMPHSPNKLANEALVLNAVLTDMVKVVGKISLYLSQLKTAKDKRYNEVYAEHKRDKENKKTDNEAKALAESVVFDEGYTYHIDGLTSWKKRIDMLYDRANEQINLYKKIYGESNKVYGA